MATDIYPAIRKQVEALEAAIYDLALFKRGTLERDAARAALNSRVEEVARSSAYLVLTSTFNPDRPLNPDSPVIAGAVRRILNEEPDDG